MILPPLGGRPKPCLTRGASPVQQVRSQRREGGPWPRGWGCPVLLVASFHVASGASQLLACPHTCRPWCRGVFPLPTGHPAIDSPWEAVGHPDPRAGQPLSFVLVPLLAGPSRSRRSRRTSGKGWAESRPVTHTGRVGGGCPNSKAIASPGHFTRRTNSVLRLRAAGWLPPAQGGGGSSLCSKATPDWGGTPLPASS